jgi:hypothetical protein
MNNPQRTRTPQGFARSVMQFLRADIGNKRVCVLVEGSSDSRLYPKFFRDVKTRVMVIKSGGKQKVLETLNILTGLTKKAIGICDADFYHLEKKYPSLNTVFFTDCHDIEMTMLNFNAVLDNALKGCLLHDTTDAILKTALQEVSYMAYARWYNEKNVCHFNFKKLDINLVFKILAGKPKLDTVKFLLELNRVSNNRTMEITPADIQKFMEIHKTEDYFNLCNGHDVILVIMLIAGSNIAFEEYQKNLQDSFTIECFVQTNLYKSILEWQTSNGFTILRTETASGC